MVRPSFIKSLNPIKEMTIKDWIIEIVWYNDFAIFCRKIGRFIRRLYRWIPLLWKQEDWDYHYIYDLIIFKMKEIRKNIEQDTWHHPDCIKEELEQIDSCLDHFDKYENWTDYIEIPEPTKDFERWTDCGDGCKTLNFTDEEHEAYQKANKFEEEHFKAFWDEFIKYHRNWWT